MAAIPIADRRRAWFPWVRTEEYQLHLADDAAVHREAKKTSDEILTGIDALNISMTSLSTKLGPLLPITSDLDQIVGRRRFRHQMYALAGKTALSIKKILGWGGGTIIGLATIAAVYPPAQSLLVWLLSELTFGTISYRIPAMPPTPIIPGIIH